jgi:biofilm protein TabA
MALFGTLPTIRTQLVHPDHFAPALAFIEEAFRPGSVPHQKLFALTPGQTEQTDLAGGAFALLQAYLTKPRSEGRWETHRVHIDVQVLFLGEEFMEVADRSKLTLQEDLTPGRDVIFYEFFNQGSVLRLGTGDIAIYFPHDGHCGGLAVTKPALVRKIVVKVPAPPAVA